MPVVSVNEKEPPESCAVPADLPRPVDPLTEDRDAPAARAVHAPLDVDPVGAGKRPDPIRASMSCRRRAVPLEVPASLEEDVAARLRRDGEAADPSVELDVPRRR